MARRAQASRSRVLDKIRVAEKLDAFGIHYIEGGWPGSNPKDIAFFEEAAKRTWKNARITAFGMTRRGKLAVEEDPQVQAAAGCADAGGVHRRQDLAAACDRGFPGLAGGKPER